MWGGGDLLFSPMWEALPAALMLFSGKANYVFVALPLRGVLNTYGFLFLRASVKQQQDFLSVAVSVLLRQACYYLSNF